jgi:solute carrier family 25 (mitochondrial phosphate transporter), member 3
MASSSQELPNFTAGDYVKFFGAGALAATSTHAVSSPGTLLRVLFLDKY